MDVIFVKDGKEYSAKEAINHLLEETGGKIDMNAKSMKDALREYGYHLKDEKKSILRRIRSAIKVWIRGRLIAIGKLEKYLAE